MLMRIVVLRGFPPVSLLMMMRGICGRCRGLRSVVTDWEDWLWEDKPMVCVVHKRFVPCRIEDKCEFSTDPVDVEMVRIYQQGRLSFW